MAQLWGGRFTKHASQFAYEFQASIGFDNRFWREDIEGSQAHVRMLAKQGILTEAERDQILDGLEAVRADLEAGKIAFTTEYEDIHSLVETELIRRIGDTGKKLHTGRSRNDQCVTDMKLYTRRAAGEIREELVNWATVLTKRAEEGLDMVMPGFTHMQKAQPVTLAHHLSAYIEMALRDISRLDDAVARMDTCPLGSAALAGTTYPLDRQYTAELLGFEKPTGNSMDSVSDRDHMLELLFDMSVIMMHRSRFCEEVIMWCSDEYRFDELDDAWCTGSSIMPQKKNADVAELVRGKTGRVYGSLMGLLTVMKGLPLAFNKDMQEDKEGFFDAIDTTKNCLQACAGMLASAAFKPEAMRRSAAGGYTNATDVADYLVRCGVPFRDAHGMSGRLVLEAIDRGCPLEQLPLECYQAECPMVKEDIYEVITPEACVQKRQTTGAPGRAAMEQAIASYKEKLKM